MSLMSAKSFGELGKSSDMQLANVIVHAIAHSGLLLYSLLARRAVGRSILQIFASPLQHVFGLIKQGNVNTVYMWHAVTLAS